MFRLVLLWLNKTSVVPGRREEISAFGSPTDSMAPTQFPGFNLKLSATVKSLRLAHRQTEF